MKSKKTIESFIGKMMFGSLMALPLLSILTRVLYVIINKNAYQSYETGELLSNAFEYALTQMQASNYYNWALSTGTYTVIHNTTNTLQINMPVLDLLLTYWLMITLIYIIFDMIYVLLMYAHDKIHGLIQKD